ncbi:flagellar biosynthesis protein FlhF [Paenalcaligenes sp. Me131]|uniref:flagellar biosynthesis protein FlhF n=1 Tax=Paenalcaligenes sp. Me131 TaxID=3392636 RepID=UPI003D2D62B0
MSVSRFFGSTSREAMRQVRLALGPDALIVSNRRVNGGVEILATDATASATPAPVSMPVPEQSQATASIADSAPTPTAAPYAGINQQQQPAELMSAIGAMRGALENRIDELLWSNQLQRAPETLSLFQSLLGYGFSTALLRAMLKRMPAHLNDRAAFEWARHELDTHLPVLASEDRLWQPGLALALVGPTGVGKTTTIAKLAARCVKRFGPDKLVLITTDTYRIGAHEQLKIYADILRVPVHVVQDSAGLRQLLLSIRPDQIILIDNVGISQRDCFVADQAALLASAGRRIQRLLALNASSHGDTLDEVARVYKTDGGTPLSGCIITKVDEASRLGPALDTAIRYQLPVHYVSDGQKVPENLRFMTAKQLVDMAFTRTSYNSKALYAPTAGDLAALLSVAEQKEPVNDADEQARKQKLTALVMSGAGMRKVDVDGLRQHTSAIEHSLALSAAFDGWRDLSVGPQDATYLAEQAEDLMRSALHEVSESPESMLLSSYQSVNLALENEQGKSKILLTTLCTERGEALAAPLQQLAGPMGWLNTVGEHVLHEPQWADQLLQAVQWVEQRRNATPIMHMLEGFTPAVWQVLAAEGTAFMASVPLGSRFWHENGTTSAAARIKQMQFHAVSDLSRKLQLQQLAGQSIPSLTLWVAKERVAIRQRGVAELPLELIAVRLTDRYSGAVLRDSVVLVNAGAFTQLSDADVAMWAVLQHEQRLVGRLVAPAWRAVQEEASTQGLSVAQQLRTSALLALAGSDVQYSSQRQGLYGQLQTLLQQRGALTAPKLIEALLRCFALKEALQEA